MSIPFRRHILKNGLRLIVHEDRHTPLASCFIAYNVGSRFENPNQTGLAHLMEHFMFSGSVHIPDYDEHLQKVGAINNAFTTQDMTCYYINLPANNLETAFWLESDRMLSLAFDPQLLEIQKSVVMEEFKEVLLNKPYSDLWALFSNLTYTQHPYQWNTIGKELSHIESVTIKDIRRFYDTFYCPNNAVLAVAGHVEFDKVVQLAEKWFSDIPSRPLNLPVYPQEPLQTESRMLKVQRNVPDNLLLKSWKMCGRNDDDYYACDLISDLLGDGHSSYLYKEFVLQKKICTDINTYISGTIDPGMIILQMRLADNVSMDEANDMLNDFLFHLDMKDSLSLNLQKVKNQVASQILRNEVKIEDRVASLAQSEIIRSVEAFENDKERYFSVSEEDILQVYHTYCSENTMCTLMYEKE